MTKLMPPTDLKLRTLSVCKLSNSKVAAILCKPEAVKDTKEVNGAVYITANSPQLAVSLLDFL